MAPAGEKLTALQGRGVLIVEDDSMVAMILEDMLQELGCHVVGIASRVDTALMCIKAENFDIAVLDVNLEGEASYPAADLLILLHLPFLFATGYGAQAIPEKYCQHTVLQKPFRKQEFEDALLRALREIPGAE
ncbi:MAG: response regulator [Beijerinckiaceae bacterium]|nr:response regulator [Beijerinckiaceae bacterium]